MMNNYLEHVQGQLVKPSNLVNTEEQDKEWFQPITTPQNCCFVHIERVCRQV